MIHLFLVNILYGVMVKICGSLFAFGYSIALTPFIEFSPYYPKMPRSRNLPLNMALIEKGLEEMAIISKNFLKLL